MNSQYNASESDYSTWSTLSTIADALRDLGLKDKADEMMVSLSNKGIIDKYLSIIIKAADKDKHADVLERLYFAGLIYG